MMMNKRLIRTVKKSKKYIAGNVISQWISLLVNMMMMGTIAKMLQNLYEGTIGEYQIVLTAIIAVVAVGIRFLCAILSSRMGYLASKEVKKILRQMIYKKLLKLGSSYREQINTSEVVQVAVEGVEQLETYFGAYLPQFFYAMLAPLTLFAFLSFVNFPSALVLLVCVPIIPVTIVMIQRWAKKLLAKYWSQYTTLGDTFLENLQGLTTTKIYQADEFKHREMNAQSEHRDYDYYAVNNVSEDEVGTIYERRISTLKNWLDSGEETFTTEEKNFLIQQYENLKTPFYYEYADGWSALLQNISTFILILALVIGFFVSGIFSDEFQTKADSIFFSTKLGRNKGVLSKMVAGFSIVSVFYILFIFLYTCIVLFVLGADGANCPIQLDLWRSVYNVTFLQAFLFIVLGGYVGTLFASLLAMLVSAITHSTTTAIIVPFIVLCAFPFLSRIMTLPQLCSFFPDQLLEIYIDIRESGLINLGGKVTTIATFIIPLYAIICLVLQPILYNTYKRAEIK